ncbi:hypothetical protein [Streptomyces griseorubiginosus]|uniref:hypothetical protein n=1 Tax=Streptomyces griseorubiginosus TaxID=67304 RepID=UPI00366341DA
MDEEKLTTDVLWEAVTGKPGCQSWYESVRITCRSPEAEAARKAENERIYGPRRERGKKAETERASEAHVKYLTALAEKVGKQRFDAEFAKVIKGSDIAPRTPRQHCATADRASFPPMVSITRVVSELSTRGRLKSLHSGQVAW